MALEVPAVGCGGRLTEVTAAPLTEPSPWVSVWDVRYRLDGAPRAWHAVLAGDAAVVMVYNAARRCFVMVRQFRAPCWLATKPAAARAAEGAGYTLEMVAGLLDKVVLMK